MNDLKPVLEKYHFHVRGMKEKGRVKIVHTDQGTYVLKRKKRDDLRDLYKYLKGKQFLNFIDSISEEEDEYEIYPYHEDHFLTEEEKIVEIAQLMSFLHNKTTIYRSILLDDVKELYETNEQKLNALEQYYEMLRFQSEEEYFLSPSKYLFLRNYTYLLQSFFLARKCLKEWYEIAKDKTSKRMVLNHNKLEPSHLLEDNGSYLISWEDAKVDSPIYDFYSFYQRNYKKMDIKKIFSIYNGRYELLENERKLLFYSLLLPEKITFLKSEIENTRQFYELFYYLKKTLNFVLEEDSRNAISKQK